MSDVSPGLLYHLPSIDQILHPWWHHPNAHYVGRHRGRYQHTITASGIPASALPYGIRSVRMTYIDAHGTKLSGHSFNLPEVQTMSFSENEESNELKGDNKLIATRGKGQTVSWELSGVGLDAKVWEKLVGPTPEPKPTLWQRVKGWFRHER